MAKRRRSFWHSRNRLAAPLVGVIAALVIDSVLKPLQTGLGFSSEWLRLVMFVSLILVWITWHISSLGISWEHKSIQRVLLPFGIGCIVVFSLATYLFYFGILFSDAQDHFTHVA